LEAARRVGEREDCPESGSCCDPVEVLAVIGAEGPQFFAGQAAESRRYVVQESAVELADCLLVVDQADELPGEVEREVFSGVVAPVIDAELDQYAVPVLVGTSDIFYRDGREPLEGCPGAGEVCGRWRGRVDAVCTE
jgi:hypothetical protein